MVCSCTLVGTKACEGCGNNVSRGYYEFRPFEKVDNSIKFAIEEHNKTMNRRRALVDMLYKLENDFDTVDFIADEIMKIFMEGYGEE